MNSRRRKRAELDALRRELSDPRNDESAAHAATKEALANPLPGSVSRPSGPWIRRGRGNVAKFSRSGELIGWYTNDQRAGRPARLMPIEADIKAAEDKYFAAIRDVRRAVAEDQGKSDRRPVAAGKASGRARPSKAAKIREAGAQLEDRGVPGQNRASIIAMKLKVTERYVRKVLAAK